MIQNLFESAFYSENPDIWECWQPSLIKKSIILIFQNFDSRVWWDINNMFIRKFQQSGLKKLLSIKTLWLIFLNRSLQKEFYAKK